MRNQITEAVGAFFIVLSIGMTDNVFGTGFILAGLYFMFSGVSGAHFNPAVSLVFYLKKDITLKQFFSYSASHITGAFLAASVIVFFSSGIEMYLEPPGETNLYHHTVAEFLLTFVLAFVYLKANPHHNKKSQAATAAALGLTYAALTVMGIKISGSVFNPAASIGVSISDYVTSRGMSFRYIPLYTLAPMAGAALASFLDTFLKKGTNKSAV